MTDKTTLCPKCLGTGFNKGKICDCITGKKTGKNELPDELKNIFGDVFRDKRGDKY